MTKRYVALLLVLAVLLAGCNGLTDDSGPETPSPGTAGVGTPTSTATPTPAPLYEPPVDGATLLDEHERSLREAESFQYVQRARAYIQERPSNRQLTDITANLTLSDGRLFLVQNVTLQGVSEVYVDAEGNGYLRDPEPTGADYRRPDPELVNRSQYVRPPLSRFVDGLDYEYVGVSRPGETRLYVYNVSRVEQADPAALDVGLFPPSNATAVASRLVVREDGTVVSFAYRVEGRTERGETAVYDLFLGYRGVGETTVPEPGWLSAARNETV